MSNGKKPAKAGDESYAVLQSLIAKGRKEGMLRASELNAELEKLSLPMRTPTFFIGDLLAK